jgi:hypothetical protein
MDATARDTSGRVRPERPVAQHFVTERGHLPPELVRKEPFRERRQMNRPVSPEQ